MKKNIIFVLLLSYLIAGTNPIVKINNDINEGLLDPVNGLELKVRALLARETLPPKYMSLNFEPLKCGADILDEAWQKRIDLSSEVNMLMEDLNRNHLVVRESYSTENFVINYEISGTDAPSLFDGNNNGTPDYIETMGQYFEDALNYIIDTVAFNNPLDWTTSNTFIVTIEELSDDGILGYVPSNSYHRIWMDNNLTDRYLKLTSVHELHHLVQHTYNISSPWYKECTSMWIEEKMYDDLNGYQGYDQSFQQKPYWSLDYFQSGGLYQYGSVLWNFYISENFGDLAVKNIWEQSSTNAITAAAAFFQNSGSNFDEEFSSFVGWNYITGYRANGTYPNGQYEEAANIAVAGNTQVFQGQITGFTPDDEHKPDHLGANYIYVNRGTNNSNNLLIEFDGINTADWNVEVITYSNGNYNSIELNTNISGDGFLVVNDWPTYSNLIIAPSVLTRYGSNFNYIIDATPIDNVIFQDELSYEISGDDPYLDPGDTLEVVVGYTNYGTPMTNLVSLIMTESAGITLIDSIFTIPSIDVSETVLNSGSPFMAVVNDSISGSSIEFVIDLAQDSEIIVSESFTINVGIVDILVIDDDDGGDSETSIVEALTQAEAAFEIIDGSSMQLDELNLDLREMIIWNTGAVVSEALPATEQQAIINFLNSGKRLLLTGDHIASQLDGTPLLNDYFNFEYTESGSGGWLKGIDGDPISDNNLNWAILNLDFTGVDLVTLNGDPRGHISYYLGIDENIGGILRYSSEDYLAVLASFDFGDITSTGENFKTGLELMSDIFSYLYGLVEYPATPVLVSPAVNAAIILSTENDSIIFEWDENIAVTGLIISSEQADIVPLLVFETEALTSLSLSYQDFVDTLNYVSDAALSWCIYSSVNGEVSLSELRPFKLTTSELVVKSDEISQPEKFYVSQNYPNPFNPTTMVDIHLPENSRVSVRIFNISGQMVAELLNTTKPAGVYQITWNGYDHHEHTLASGVYFLQVIAGNLINNQKMIFVK